jgi:hypothetical protein
MASSEWLFGARLSRYKAAKAVAKGAEQVAQRPRQPPQVRAEITVAGLLRELAAAAETRRLASWPALTRIASASATTVPNARRR